LDLINDSLALAPLFEDESTSNPPRQAITWVDWGKTHVRSPTGHSSDVLAMVSNWPKVWGWGTLNPRGSPQRSLPEGFEKPRGAFKSPRAGWSKTPVSPTGHRSPQANRFLPAKQNPAILTEFELYADLSLLAGLATEHPRQRVDGGTFSFRRRLNNPRQVGRTETPASRAH
jgi:hypothetical protein